MPAAEGQASDSGGRDDSEGHGLSECVRCVVDLPSRAARPDPRGAPLWIDSHASHGRQIDHQPVVDTGKPGPIVRAGADRDGQCTIAAEIDGRDNVGCVGAARDKLWALIDHRVVKLAGVVVVRIALLNDGPTQRRCETGNGLVFHDALPGGAHDLPDVRFQHAARECPIVRFSCSDPESSLLLSWARLRGGSGCHYD